MNKFLFSLFMLSAPVIINAQPQNKNKGAFDGQKYKAEITEDGKKKPLDPDDLSFMNGKFKSSLFVDWGFEKAGKYEITKIDSSNATAKVYSWTAELIDAQDEKLEWSGSITGDEIEGTIEYVSKKGSTKKTYTFTGKLKKKPGQK
ncbi:MAG: hypothetical protein ACHQHP_00175 [Bacteroidia bacterium]